MSEEQQLKAGQVTEIANAVAAVVKEVPVYQDAIQPAAQELGKALGTVAKLVNIALAPVSGLVWGYEQIREFTATKVAEKLKGVPEEEIITPKPNVAGPAIEALRYTGHEESLSEMYANLLATAMTKDKASLAHPAFVEIIRQLTPDEAKILALFNNRKNNYPIISVMNSILGSKISEGFVTAYENFSHIGVAAGCEHLSLVPSYLDNLCRLGLCNIPEDAHYTDDSMYKPLIEDAFIVKLISGLKEHGRETDIHKRLLNISTLGRQFANACTNKEDKME